MCPERIQVFFNRKSNKNQKICILDGPSLKCPTNSSGRPSHRTVNADIFRAKVKPGDSVMQIKGHIRKNKGQGQGQGNLNQHVAVTVQ